MALMDIINAVSGFGNVQQAPGNAQFKLNDFISQVKSGVAKPCRFEVSISNPRCINNPAWGKTVSLMCDQAMLPMTRLITSRQQIFGPPSFHPVGVDYGGDNLGMQFLVDREMNVKNYFDSWVDGIVNHTNYTTAYQARYLTSMEIRQLDEADNVVYAVKLEDIFPVVVNPLQLDSGLANSVHKLNVTFNYRRWYRIGIGPQTVPANTKNNILGGLLNIQNGNINYFNNNPTAQQQAQNLLQPGYGADSYFLVK
jgi:hypothetical protein